MTLDAEPKPFTCPRCDVAYTDLCTPIMCARLDSDGDPRRPEMVAFIELNPDTMKGFTQEMADQAEGYAEHHAGGLHVLGKRTEHGYLKMHDTWGPGPEDNDGPIIVHHYGPDAINADLKGSEVIYGHDYTFREDGALVLDERQWREEEPDVYQPQVLEPNEDGLYSLGAYGWVWSEDTTDPRAGTCGERGHTWCARCRPEAWS